MAFQQRDNSGALFKNEKREKDTHPHARGSALIDGVEYWVDAWTRDGTKGKFQSLAFKRKDNAKKAEKKQEREPGSDDEFNDEVPF